MWVLFSLVLGWFCDYGLLFGFVVWCEGEISVVVCIMVICF